MGLPLRGHSTKPSEPRWGQRLDHATPLRPLFLFLSLFSFCPSALAIALGRVLISPCVRRGRHLRTHQCTHTHSYFGSSFSSPFQMRHPSARPRLDDPHPQRESPATRDLPTHVLTHSLAYSHTPLRIHWQSRTVHPSRDVRTILATQDHDPVWQARGELYPPSQPLLLKPQSKHTTPSCTLSLLAFMPFHASASRLRSSARLATLG